jgi:CBS domain containing-hemolysin-like protein
MENPKIEAFDFVSKYELVHNALRAFSFTLQLSLFISGFFLLETFMPNPSYRILALIGAFVFVFNFLLYSLSYFNKEALLKRLIFLYPIPWIFFYPFNLVFGFFLEKNPEQKENDQDDLSDKELEIFLEEGAKEGVLETEDKEMIESILEFGDTRVKEIMTPRVDMIYIDIYFTLDNIIKTVNEKKKSRLPVISERIDNIEGIVLTKDLFEYIHKENFNIKEILRPAFFIPETMRILELLKELQQMNQKFAIVVDEFGGVSGVVTMEDIIEEIVGEIQDEYDEDIQQIVKEKDHFIVKGDTDVFELAETLEIKIEEDEDYQTVGGLISFKLGKIPDKFDKVSIEHYTFEVLEIEKNRIEKVKIYHEQKQ